MAVTVLDKPRVRHLLVELLVTVSGVAQNPFALAGFVEDRAVRVSAMLIIGLGLVGIEPPITYSDSPHARSRQI